MVGADARIASDCLRTYGRYVDWSPVDGTAVDRNPPPLTWPWNPQAGPPSAPGEWSFRLTVAGDARLVKPLLREPVEFNTFAMLPALTPGATYFWQVEWLNKDGAVAQASAVRRFTVAADAARYDLSALRTLTLPEHPRFCCRPEDVPMMRAARDGKTPFGLAAQEVKARALKMVEYGKLAPPQAWSFAPQIRELAAASLLWGDQEPGYAKLGIAGLVQACRENAKLPETLPGGDYAGVVHTEMLFEAYDWLYAAMTPEDRALCAEALAARAHSLCQSGRIVLAQSAAGKDASHPLEWLITGAMGAWVLAAERPELAPDLRMGINYCLAQPGSYSQGLGWTEGRGYGRAHLHRIAQEVLAPVQIGLGIPVAQYAGWDRIARFFAEMTPVGEDREPFGDGGSYQPGGWGQPVLLTSALAGDWATFQRLQLKGESMQYSMIGTNIPHTPEAPMLAYYLTPQPGTLAQRTRLLAPDAGFVVEHTDSRDAKQSLGFIFKCSPQGWTNHCLADQGSFALYAWGEMLAANTGWYGNYGNPQDQQFLKPTISKNSLLINGRGQARNGGMHAAEGRLIAYKTTGQFVYTCGSFGNSYAKETGVVSAFRHLLFVRDRYFVIFDDVTLAQPGTVQWLYHLPTDCAVDGLEGGTLDYHSHEVKVAFRMANRDVAGTMSTRAIGMDGVDYTNDQLVASKQGGGPATHLRFEPKTPAAHHQFLTVIVPYKDAPPVIDVIDARHVRITCDGATDVIGFGPAKTDMVDYQAIERGE